MQYDANQSNFYPRPPRGGRHVKQLRNDVYGGFLSTPSARRATRYSLCCRIVRFPFLSTPSARRATCVDSRSDGRILDFYPRPPRGGRRAFFVLIRHEFQFLSTPSARRATSEVSSDESAQDNFYPRPPRGGRRHATGNHCKASRFLSTPSARRATCQPRPGSRPDQFLSTPSARRATRVYLKVCYAGRFLSTPSARRATSRKLLTERYAIISIHALREEGDAGIHRCRSWGKPISIHALREEGD